MLPPYPTVGQGRSGAFTLSQWLSCIAPRFIEAPFADENTPNFSGLNSILILKKGVFCPHSPKNHHD